MILKSITGGVMSAVVALSLSACTTSFSNFELSDEVAETASYSMYDDFNRYLAAEYSRYVTFKEYQLGVPFSFFDYRDVAHFADKGEDAAEGDMVDMEMVADWPIRNAADADSLNAMRKRIADLFAAGSKSRYAHLSARAQVLFDCNVELAERRYFAPRTEYCDMDTLKYVVDMIDNRMNAKAPMVVEDVTPKAVMVAETVETAPVIEPAEPKVRIIRNEVPRQVLDQIYFGFDSDKIKPAGMEVVTRLVDYAQTGQLQKINVVGYTDRAGPVEYNLDLSMRRALAVEKALLENGFPKELISATGVGESEPQLQTADGVPSARNRVVKIELAYTEVEEKEVIVDPMQ